MSDRAAYDPNWRVRARRCWHGDCPRAHVLRDWTGWKYCLRHWLAALARHKAPDVGRFWYARTSRIDWMKP